MTNSRRGPLLLILFAALMAGAGNGISLVAFPWLVLQRNGSALDVRLLWTSFSASTSVIAEAVRVCGQTLYYQRFTRSAPIMTFDLTLNRHPCLQRAETIATDPGTHRCLPDRPKLHVYGSPRGG